MSSRTPPPGGAEGRLSILKEWASPGAPDRQLARRASYVLAMLEGSSREEAAELAGAKGSAGWKWTKRYAEGGAEGLLDIPAAPSPQKAGGPPPPAEEDLALLAKWAAPEAPDRELARRAAAVLGMLKGQTQQEAGDSVGASRTAAGLWKRAFAKGGPDALLDKAKLPGRLKGDEPPPCSEGELATLEEWAAPGAPDRALARRAAVILGILKGLTQGEAAAAAGACRNAAGAWVARFASRGPYGLLGRTNRLRGAPPCPEEHLKTLIEWADPDSPDRMLARRAASVLGSLMGLMDAEAGALAGVNRQSAGFWKLRFEAGGPEALAGRARLRKRRGPPGAAPRTEEELSVLREWAAPGAPDRELARRAASVLGILGGLTAPEAAAASGASPASASNWTRRFKESGPDALRDWSRGTNRLMSFVERAAPEGSLAALEGLAAPGAPDRSLARRAVSVLGVLNGLTLAGAAEFAGASVTSVVRWIRRFRDSGPDGLIDRPFGWRFRDVGPLPFPSETAVAVIRGWAEPGAPDRELARRSSAVLGKLGGLSFAEAAGLHEARPESVAVWIKRFRELGPDGLVVIPHAGNRRGDGESPAASDGDLAALEEWAEPGAPDRELARRASAVLGILNGLSSAEAGELAGASASFAKNWKRRFDWGGSAGLADVPRGRSAGLPRAGFEPFFNDRDLVALKAWTAPGAPDKVLARRAGAVLGRLNGLSYAEAAAAGGVDEATVRAWARRFADEGPEGLRRMKQPPPRGGTDDDGSEVPPRDHEAELATIVRWAAPDGPDSELAARASAVLARLEGFSRANAAAVSGIEPAAVTIWEKRFAEEGPAGLLRKPKRRVGPRGSSYPSPQDAFSAGQGKPADGPAPEPGREAAGPAPVPGREEADGPAPEPGREAAGPAPVPGREEADGPAP
ncbi:MAG: helix-turn-helix domain-containing protein, partial [Deltaproteobacteria bacterium]|nr:helix-turn-helix domain-containing protein [Deltaproteobacteria bacterium]